MEKSTDNSSDATPDDSIEAGTQSPSDSRSAPLAERVFRFGERNNHNFDLEDVQMVHEVHRVVEERSKLAAENSQLMEENKQLKAELQALSDKLKIEPKTGLLTAEQFEPAVKEALTSAETGTAVIVIDLDKFKQVNDTAGHPAGDWLLKVIGERLSRATRGGDLAFRIGGDELALLLKNIDPHKQEGLARHLQHLNNVITFPVGSREGDDQTYSVGASFGVTVVPAGAGAVDPMEVINQADELMYIDKITNKNAVAAGDVSSTLSGRPIKTHTWGQPLPLRPELSPAAASAPR